MGPRKLQTTGLNYQTKVAKNLMTHVGPLFFQMSTCTVIVIEYVYIPVAVLN